ncbi:MAG: peptidoglycan-binding protein [Chloroflexi bacterium]|nr:peptidoglycan-binding protein [Chloroflexota bacterium]
MRRRVILSGVTILAVAATVAGAAGSGLLSLDPGSVGAADLEATAPPDTATIERRTLETTDEFDGTLGYDGSIEIVGGLGGTITKLPEAGTILERGDRIVELDGGQVSAILLYGTRPAWRSLGPDVSDGLDVLQLEENLAALGLFEGLTPDRTWDDDTSEAVEVLQKQVYLPIDGTLALGEVVFEPGPVRVTEAVARVGGQVGPGQTLLRASSTNRVIAIDLGVSDKDRLPEGAAVEIELPDGTLVPGTVTAVGRVATSQDDGFGGAEATIDVTVVPDDPSAVEGLDAAPVTIHVVGSVREDVLTVPVSAMLALLEGGYAVEVIDDDGSTHYVAVDAGLFQDGIVEIRGDGLEEGLRVVIP